MEKYNLLDRQREQVTRLRMCVRVRKTYTHTHIHTKEEAIERDSFQRTLEKGKKKQRRIDEKRTKREGEKGQRVHRHPEPALTITPTFAVRFRSDRSILLAYVYAIHIHGSPATHIILHSVMSLFVYVGSSPSPNSTNKYFQLIRMVLLSMTGGGKKTTSTTRKGRSHVGDYNRLRRSLLTRQLSSLVN